MQQVQLQKGYASVSVITEGDAEAALRYKPFAIKKIKELFELAKGGTILKSVDLTDGVKIYMKVTGKVGHARIVAEGNDLVCRYAVYYGGAFGEYLFLHYIVPPRNNLPKVSPPQTVNDWMNNSAGFRQVHMDPGGVGNVALLHSTFNNGAVYLFESQRNTSAYTVKTYKWAGAKGKFKDDTEVVKTKFLIPNEGLNGAPYYVQITPTSLYLIYTDTKDVQRFSLKTGLITGNFPGRADLVNSIVAFTSTYDSSQFLLSDEKYIFDVRLHYTPEGTFIRRTTYDTQDVAEVSGYDFDDGQGRLSQWIYFYRERSLSAVLCGDFIIVTHRRLGTVELEDGTAVSDGYYKQTPSYSIMMFDRETLVMVASLADMPLIGSILDISGQNLRKGVKGTVRYVAEVVEEKTVTHALEREVIGYYENKIEYDGVNSIKITRLGQLLPKLEAEPTLPPEGTDVHDFVYDFGTYQEFSYDNKGKER